MAITSHLLTSSRVKLPPLSGAVGGEVAMFVEIIGTFGVNVFFVISGFVIAGGLVTETAREGRASVWRF